MQDLILPPLAGKVAPTAAPWEPDGGRVVQQICKEGNLRHYPTPTPSLRADPPHKGEGKEARSLSFHAATGIVQ